jgi:hypothetical protein
MPRTEASSLAPALFASLVVTACATTTTTNPWMHWDPKLATVTASAALCDGRVEPNAAVLDEMRRFARENCDGGYRVVDAGVPRSLLDEPGARKGYLWFAQCVKETDAQHIVVVEAHVDLGDISTTASTRRIEIDNDGKRPLTVSSLNVDEEHDFTATPERALPTTIAPRGSLFVDVNFISTRAGRRLGALHVLSDDPTSPDVVVPLAATRKSLVLPSSSPDAR